ncbi:MAG: DDE-type integrase/transposase/recombinase, partial [Sulfurospirillum sp.]|nr:DDE-type integrase/transposase/recombinase [Sulfurospirillum sp.]
MPDAACRYSSSEIELCGLKKSIIHFQYLLKYAHFTVIMDNSSLRMIYASKKESKTNRIQKYLEELSDYSFTIEHSPGAKMFISDYLSRFSAANEETASIPFLTSREDLTGNMYMNDTNITKASNNINNQPVCREDHSFPLTRSQAKAQNISLPGLFSAGGGANKTRGKVTRPVKSQISDNIPPSMPANKSHSSSITPVHQPVARKRGRPFKIDTQIVTEHGDNLPTIIARRRRNRHTPSQGNVYDLDTQPIDSSVGSDSLLETIYKGNNMRESLTNSNREVIDQGINIPFVEETVHIPDMSDDFPRLLPLTTKQSSNIKIKTRKDMPNQSFIDKILGLLHHKGRHFYHLPFELEVLRKEQRRDNFMAPIIEYLESNHLPSNIKRQQSIISETENFILFNNVLYRVVDKSVKTFDYKIALCIPLGLAHKLFELFHSGMLTSHQGLTRTYYKIRQDFYIRNLYKHLYLFIMSCRICSARRNIPFNQKQRGWTHSVITDFKIMDSISMDLKVMPTSNRGYNYLLVMRCNNSRFIVTECLKTRQAKEVVEAIFQNLICAHGTNISKIYCDLDTCFKNEIMDIMTRTLGIKVQFCSVDAHQANPAERSIQDVSKLLLHYIAKYGNTWSYFHRAC